MFNGENPRGFGGRGAISKIASCWASVVSANINGIHHKKHTEETENTSVLHCPQVLIQCLIHQFHISSFCLTLSRDILVKIRPLYVCFYLLFLFFPMFYLLSLLSCPLTCTFHVVSYHPRHIPHQDVNQCFKGIFFCLPLPLTGLMNNQIEEFLPVCGMTIN